MVCRFSAAKNMIESVDRWFPQVQPDAPMADGEAEVQKERPAGERRGGAELVVDLLFEGSPLTRCAGPDRVEAFDLWGVSTGTACSTRMNDVSPWCTMRTRTTLPSGWRAARKREQVVVGIVLVEQWHPPSPQPEPPPPVSSRSPDTPRRDTVGRQELRASACSSWHLPRRSSNC
jgi:hypothetical protein